uniref:MtrB/PioB family decaheme-associated outer membrane protein n=1 Tax=Oleiagrimonas sp. TaxID=2010330 RepID=UPI002605EDEB
MKSYTDKLFLKSLSLAILMALPLAASAQSADDVANLIKPTNYLEFGLGYVQHDSAQFGQYNGLGSSGPYLIGNFGLTGGDAYGQNSGTRVWSVTGTDLGTTSRSIDARIRDQGKWNLGLRFDQLRHNISDTYETPLQGSMGGNVFTMPSGFGVVSAARPSTPDPYGTRTLTATQQAYFHRVKVHTERQNTGVTVGYDFNPHWNTRFNWNHMEQSGAKLISSGTDENTPSAGFALAGYGLRGEAIQVLMNPTNYTTDNLDLALNWRGSRAFLSVAFYASNFTDHYDSVSFPNPYTTTNVANGTILPGAYPMDALSTPPSNKFNRGSLTAGYNITPRTRLVGGYSYGRNTQNQNYVNLDQMQPGGLPATSLHGRVIITHADLNLTNRTTRHLSLSAGMNFDKRDNRTPAYAYDYFDLGGEAVTSVNIPLSYSKSRGELSADYRFGHGQHLRAAYEYEKTHRWCNSALSNNAQGDLPTAFAGYYTVASCVQVPKNVEDKYVLTYRANATEQLDFNAGYSYSDRTATVNASFYNPMQAISEGFENFGYRAYFDASRTQQMIKAGTNWQASKHLSFSLDGRATYDNYTDSPLGVQDGHSLSLNFDTTLVMSEHASASLYASAQRRTRALLSAYQRNAVAPPANTWTNDLTDKAAIYGITAQRGGLMGGKLKLIGDLSYSLDTTRYYTALNYVDAACTAPSRGGYSCGAVPDIRSQLSRLRLTANYAIDRKSTLVFGY